jgi:TPR repeat protein
MYESGTPATPQDREIALAYFARSCRLEAQSCLRLSHFYEDHPELLPPHSETFPQTLLSYACLAGNMLACALMRQKHIEQKKKLPLIG